MQKLSVLLVLVVWTLAASQALATPIISLVPDPAKVHVGHNLTLDVDISGLQSGGTNTTLGAFDLTVVFNPNILALLLAGPSTLGTGLGDPTDPLQTAQGATLSLLPNGLESFRFFEVSLLETSSTNCVFCSGPFLADIQSDTFTLATLTFFAPADAPWTSAPGAPPSILTSIFFLPPGPGGDPNVILSDGDGNGIPIPLSNIHSSTVVVAVPEPSTILIYLAGLGVLCLGLRISQRRSIGA